MMAFAQIALKDTVTSSRGSRSSQVRNEDGTTKIHFLLGTAQDPIQTPFGATSFSNDGNSRITIEFSFTPEQEKYWQSFDQWAVAYLTKHSFRLFKRL